MKSQGFDPALYALRGEELPLSRVALVGLMREVLARGKPFRFRAKGWSMMPFILDGDVISVSPLRRGRPGIGEVVAFVRPGSESLVVHRVVARQRDACFIQSDNFLAGEDLVPYERILGRVTRVERRGRKVRLGLGPERFAIAYLSRLGLLWPVWRRVISLVRLLSRRGTR